MGVGCYMKIDKQKRLIIVEKKRRKIMQYFYLKIFDLVQNNWDVEKFPKDFVYFHEWSTVFIVKICIILYRD